MTELMSCPICGKLPHIECRSRDDRYQRRLVCCLGSTSWQYFYTDARDIWNEMVLEEEGDI